LKANLLLCAAVSGNAQVPGGIFSDLKKANILKEDFFFRYNDVQYRWVSWDNWTYHTTFKGFSHSQKRAQVCII
jgi:beta-mannosidase